MNDRSIMNSATGIDNVIPSASANGNRSVFPDEGAHLATGANSEEPATITDGGGKQNQLSNASGSTMSPAESQNVVLRLGAVTQIPSATVAPASVVTKTPSAGDLVNAGSAVNLRASSGATATLERTQKSLEATEMKRR
jgi:hypothetical protein